ncbi:hypothetical protein B0H66DRAFT_541359 [Apodospora peruviana]|uniref:Uncharacterized protein n=1 Tax=Apodospora peruviana TaxID=516989 RepID=A0AAE0IR57_9PEZI|nr:hypothetical protein B0H66DRAFT_541359 [Apodospora peruviana]
MDLSSASASTLTRQRISVAILSLAAVGLFCYRIYDPLPDPAAGQRLRRSNAVRHRRRSLPDINHHGDRRERRASGVSSVTADDESHAGDENLDLLNNVRPLTDGETVADDDVLDDNWYQDPALYPHPRAGQNIVNLLFRVSQENAQRTSYVHRGCQCNACGILPIRGIRYRCANCADFDLCESCESQGLHTKTHIFYKIRIPAPRLGPRHLQPVWYPGDPDNCVRALPKHLIAKLSKDTGYERPELEAFWEQWSFTANTEWRDDPDELCLAMDRKTFERYMVPSGGDKHIASNLLYDRMFAFYDTNNDDLIGFTEFLHGTAYRKRKDRLRKIFQGYDIDGDGFVDRRDFLRLFRSYYALFKQMHRDISDGLDDQVMSSTEVQQLITSRQPLSSYFGREGGIPRGDVDRPLEGKVLNIGTGDVLISDGRTDAINEDKADTAEREVVLGSLFSKEARFAESLFSPVHEDNHSSGAEHDSRYFTGLLNPPIRVDELAALVAGDTREGDDMFIATNAGDEDSESSEDIDGIPDGAGDNGGASANGTPGDLDPYLGQAYQRGSKVAKNRRIRVNARRKLIERWKRRQFYLDEEEGALPPSGWEEKDDILANLPATAESSKSAQQNHPLLSPRSRSSSKVRFAEDTDDYDIRSNPSTSSRSVPERWGGMDIPVAERDAGKEILYQVVQQAFNELLDKLFKEKEDLAVKAAETKELRNLYRPFFESINLEEENHRTPESPSGSPRWSMDDGFRKPIEERSLPELLQTSGYSINGSTQVGDENVGVPAEVTEEAALGDKLATNNDHNEDVTIKEADTEYEVAVGQKAPKDAGPALEASADNLTPTTTIYRDPTMPQFRPNSVLTTEPGSNQSKPPSSALPDTTSTLEDDEAAGLSVSNGTSTERKQRELLETLVAAKGKQAATSSAAATDDPPPSSSTAAGGATTTTPATKEGVEERVVAAAAGAIAGARHGQVSRRSLVKWKRLDIAEEEAKQRGGWGRLSYEEFERIYNTEARNGSRLDYLGVWIDFCIPYH